MLLRRSWKRSTKVTTATVVTFLLIIICVCVYVCVSHHPQTAILITRPPSLCTFASVRFFLCCAHSSNEVGVSGSVLLFPNMKPGSWSLSIRAVDTDPFICLSSSSSSRCAFQSCTGRPSCGEGSSASPSLKVGTWSQWIPTAWVTHTSSSDWGTRNTRARWGSATLYSQFLKSTVPP